MHQIQQEDYSSLSLQVEGLLGYSKTWAVLHLLSNNLWYIYSQRLLEALCLQFVFLTSIFFKESYSNGLVCSGVLTYREGWEGKHRYESHWDMLWALWNAAWSGLSFWIPEDQGTRTVMQISLSDTYQGNRDSFWGERIYLAGQRDFNLHSWRSNTLSSLSGTVRSPQNLQPGILPPALLGDLEKCYWPATDH